MKPYPKIETLYRRDEGTRKVIPGEFRLEEYEYLKDLEWVATEKVDGTNIRVGWNGSEVKFGGRTDKASIPAKLVVVLNRIFTADQMRKTFDPDPDKEIEVCFYGEGYGAGIQKGGGNYLSDAVNFVLFDVYINGWYLRRDDVAGMAETFGIGAIPEVATGTLGALTQMVRNGFLSRWGNFPAEGVVARSKVELYDRGHHRIITKIKTRDFEPSIEGV